MYDDPLVKMLRGVDDSMETWEYTHASNEAARLLHANWAKFYDERQDAEVKKLLADAEKARAPALYLKAIKLFPWSVPAREGLRDLAHRLVESGDYVGASVYYDRLCDLR